MVYRPWQISRPQPQTVRALAGALGLPELVCSVLAARGFDTPARAAEVCGPGQELSDPLALSGMEAAVERIRRAIDEGERILVFGDYDVDGVTATALVYTWLDAAGADVYYKLPSREEDGYGLSESTVELAAQKGVKLIVTVDNGISAVGPAARAAALGVDLVVTDHHVPPAQLPAAAALVDPLLPGDKSPCKTLSGAGVAFKLVCALDGAQPQEMLPFYGDLAAVGTIADVMLLEGENRALVKAGLELLQSTDRPGLAALIAACGLEGKPLTAENVAFALAPRLNAAGRMDSATSALQLLLSEDEDEAAELAQQLEDRNAERQKAEKAILDSVLQTLEADPGYAADRILVVWGQNYHPGVIGIVASRLVEQTGKPAIVISLNGEGEGRGSGRSVEGVSLYDALAACAQHLVRFGGHEQAAGLSIQAAELPAFRAAVNAWAAQHHPVMTASALHVDAPVSLASLTADAVGALSVLAPFGNGNPQPLFLVENAVLEAVYPLSEGRHTRLRLRQGQGALTAVLFGRGPASLGYAVGDAVDAVVSLSLYEGKNGTMLSARLRDVRPAGLGEEYLEGVRLAQALTCGAPLTRAQRADICPARADTAALYRSLAAHPGGVPAEDLRPLFAKLGPHSAGKALVSLTALAQLGLAERRDGAWRILPSRDKKDLASAPVLQKLEG